MSSVARAATPSRCFDNLTVDHHPSSRPHDELGSAGGNEGDPNMDNGHWSRAAYECEVQSGPDGSFDFIVEGGSDNGEFPFVGGPPNHPLHHRQHQRIPDQYPLARGDILLEIYGQKIAGYTQRDVVSWLGYCARTCCNSVKIKAVRSGYLTKDLRQYLNARFQKGSLDHDLQNTIRDNLYLRTVPCTTRTPRCGEINGVDYTFLTVEEFVALERSGNLLESGIYEGNLYGTPRPAPAASAFSANISNLVPSSSWVHKGNYYGSPKPLTDVSHSPEKRNNSLGNCGSLFIPGPHASSEGKRRRNRSNVEAMASKTSDASEYTAYSPHTRSSTPVASLPNGIGYKALKPANFSPSDQGLHDLSQNVEQSFSENYYFGHNTSGSSIWHDPRLPALPRTSVGDPCDNDLPFGWERIDDPHYGTYYIDHVNRRTQYENPVLHVGPDPNAVAKKISCRSLSWHSNKSEQRSDNSRSTGPRSPGSEAKTSPRTSRNSSLTQTTNCSNARDSITPANTNSESLLIEGHSLHPTLNASVPTTTSNNPLSSSPASTHRFPYLHCIPCLNEKHDPPKHPLPSDSSPTEGGGLVPNGMLANEPLLKKADGEQPIAATVIPPGSASSCRTVDSRFSPACLGTDTACRDFYKPSSLTGLVTQPKRPSFFTRNPEELRGVFFRIPLVKSSRGLGFTIIGGSNPTTQELLQVKDVVPYGPAWCDGQLQTGDILVYVNGKCVLGYTHNDIISQFQSIPAGEIVELQVCRGYPLPFDPNDPNTEIVTTVAVSVANAKGLDCQNVYSVSHADSHSNSTSINTTNAKSTDLMTRTAKSMPDLSTRRGEHNSSGNVNPGMEHSETFSGPFSSTGPSTPSYLTMDIVKGTAGFGFTIADSCYGQKVKKILDRPRCKQLQEGDVLAEINGQSVQTLPHAEVVQILKDCPCGEKAQVSVQRGGFLSPIRSKIRSKMRNNESESKWNDSALRSSPFYQPSLHGLKEEKAIANYRSKTPTAELYSTRDKDPVVVSRPKTPLVDSRNWIKSSPTHSSLRKHSSHDNTPSKPMNMNELSNCDQLDRETSAYLFFDEDLKMFGSSLSRENSNQKVNDRNFRDLFIPSSKVSENTFSKDAQFNSHFVNRNKSIDPTYSLPNESRAKDASEDSNLDITNSEWQPSVYNFNYHPENSRSIRPSNSNNYSFQNSSIKSNHTDPFTLYKSQFQPHISPHSQSNNNNTSYPSTSWNEPSGPKENGFTNNTSVFSPISFLQGNLMSENRHFKKHSTSFEHEHPVPYSSSDLMSECPKPRNLNSHVGKMSSSNSFINMFITLSKQNNGFGFRIVGGTEEGSQASVGHIVPGGAADVDGRLRSGDEILGVDGNSVINCSHRQVVQLMSNAASNGKVTLHIRRPNSATNGPNNAVNSKFPENGQPYDVTVTRNENEGFGFVLISSVSRPGSTIGRLIEGSPADRCGQLRVGDIIQAVNGISILHMHHGDIVSLIKDSGYSVVLTITHPQDDASSITSASQKGEESSLDPDDSFHSVELQRGAKGFGFSIRGGREFHNMPLFILRIAENGPAHQDGRLQVGDQIVEINSVSTKNMTHAEAIELIRAGGNAVRLLIKRNSLSFSAENANVYHHLLLPSTSESPHLQMSQSMNEATTCQTTQ